MSKSRILNVANISFNSIRENKNLAKISNLQEVHWCWTPIKGPTQLSKLKGNCTSDVAAILKTIYMYKATFIFKFV